MPRAAATPAGLERSGLAGRSAPWAPSGNAPPAAWARRLRRQRSVRRSRRLKKRRRQPAVSACSLLRRSSGRSLLA
eukprot:7193072-Alexandrium_andersonii.AAC.1